MIDNKEKMLEIESKLNEYIKKIDELKDEPKRKDEIDATNKYYDDLILEIRKRKDEIDDLEQTIEMLNRERADEINNINKKWDDLFNSAKYYMNKYNFLKAEGEIEKLKEYIKSLENKISTIINYEINSLESEAKDKGERITSIEDKMQQTNIEYEQNKKDVSQKIEEVANTYSEKYGQNGYLIPENMRTHLLKCIEGTGVIPRSILDKCQEITFEEALDENFSKSYQSISKEYVEDLENLEEERKKLLEEKNKIESKIERFTNITTQNISENDINELSEDKRSEIVNCLDKIGKLNTQIDKLNVEKDESKELVEKYGNLMINYNGDIII